MVTKLCKARNPSTCRYHSSLVSSVSDEILSKLERNRQIEERVEWTKQMFARLASTRPSHISEIIRGLDYEKDSSDLDEYNQRYESLFSVLTDEEKNALQEYTGLGYLVVNEYLRLGEEEFIRTSKPQYVEGRLRKAKNLVKNLDKIFKKSFPSQEPQTLYRYLNQDTTEKFTSSEKFAIQNGWVEGRKITFSSYLSTTIDPKLLDVQISEDAEENTSVIFIIKTHRGIPVSSTPTNISRVKSIQDAEREILLPRGMSFRVTKVTREVGFEPPPISNNSRIINPLTIFVEEV